MKGNKMRISYRVACVITVLASVLSSCVCMILISYKFEVPVIHWAPITAFILVGMIAANIGAYVLYEVYEKPKLVKII
jgi:uncharacterized phage infection (PIP) family protein YhgE